MRRVVMVLALLPLLMGAKLREPPRDTTVPAVPPKMRDVTNRASSRFLWNRTGDPWRVPATPTLACDGATLGAATPYCLDASGAQVTLTKAGAPTQVDAFLFPAGFGGAAAKGVKFDGSTSRFSGPFTFDVTNGWTACVDVTYDSVDATARYILGKDDMGANRSFILNRFSNGMNFWILNGGTNQALSAPAVVDLGRHVACFAYQPVGAGTSIMRENVDGSAGARSDAPLQGAFDAQAFEVGGNAAGGAGSTFDGRINGVVWWNGWAASAAELDRMVRARLSMLGTANEPVTVTGPATAACNGAACGTSPANTLSVGPSGAQVYGAYTQRVLWPSRLDNAAWTKTGTAAAVLASGVCPDGSDGTLISGIDAGSSVYISAGGFTANGAVASSAFIKRVSVSGTLLLRNTNDASKGTLSIDLAAIGANWTRIFDGAPGVTTTTPFTATAGGAAGLQFLGSASAISFYVCRANQTDGATLYPPVDGAGSAVAVAATTTYSDLSGVSDAEGCVLAEFTPPNSLPSFAYAVGTTTSVPIYAATATRADFYDGTNTVNGPTDFANISTRPTWRVLSWWKGAVAGVRNADTGSETTGTYRGTIWGGARLYFGTQGGIFLNGSIRAVVVGPCKDCCQ